MLGTCWHFDSSEWIEAFGLEKDLRYQIMPQDSGISFGCQELPREEDAREEVSCRHDPARHGVMTAAAYLGFVLHLLSPRNTDVGHVGTHQSPTGFSDPLNSPSVSFVWRSVQVD